MAAHSARREVLFEFLRQGAYMRVAAVDAATGVEAVVLGPANAARSDLEALALRKLERALAREAG
ncbi:MAG: serine hydroxymethyltransferase [Hyphomonadaceae bacterium]